MAVLTALAVLAGGALQYQHQFLPVHVGGGAPSSIGQFSRPALASPTVSVIDGDTVRSGGETYRLVGIDTPETGGNARCAGERARGEAATRRLRGLVAAGGVDLVRVPCACRPGTEGTSACNYGRSCGVLRSHGRDVAGILIAEGLARPYHCGSSGCPRRRSWCG